MKLSIIFSSLHHLNPTLIALFALPDITVIALLCVSTILSSSPQPVIQQYWQACEHTALCVSSVKTFISRLSLISLTLVSPSSILISLEKYELIYYLCYVSYTAH